MADADGQVSGGNFRQFVLAFHNPQFHNKKLVKQHNDILIKFVRIKLINSDISIKKIDPEFAFVFEKPDSDSTFCLFTTSWFQNPDIKIQICFWSNQTGPKIALRNKKK